MVTSGIEFKFSWGFALIFLKISAFLLIDVLSVITFLLALIYLIPSESFRREIFAILKKSLGIDITRPTCFHSDALITQGQRPGIDITFNSSDTHPISLTPAWRMAGWSMQFAQLAPHAKLALDRSLGKVYVKVITGSLIQPQRNAIAPSLKDIRTTLVEGEYIQAADKETIIVVVTKTNDAPGVISNVIEQALVTGPKQELLAWHRVDEYDWGKQAFKCTVLGCW